MVWSTLPSGINSPCSPMVCLHYSSTFHRSLASGFLSGNFARGSAAGTPFGGDSPVSQFTRKLYADEKLHAAFFKLDECTKDVGITTTEAALRWACYHSALTPEDGTILGASKIAQLESNIASIGRGPPPKKVVDVSEGIWIELEPTKGEIL